MQFLITVSIAMLAGLLMSRLAKLLQLPAVTAYLVAGLVVGPFVLGAIDVSALGLPGVSSFGFTRLDFGLDGGEINPAFEMISKIAEQTGLNEEQVIRFVRNTLIYSHGIATMVATGVFKGTEKEMMAMINDAADAFILKEGIDPDKMPKKEKK